ncbi:MAG: C4-dicarboxylate ABC transporter substrate-binding protein [Pseudomonadota bacterium]
MVCRFLSLLAGAAALLLPLDTARAQETTWDVSLWGKPRAFTYHVEELAARVERATRGAFKITVHYGGLSKPRQNLEGIAQGQFEMAQFCAGYHPEKNQAITVLELPFLGIESLEQEVSVSRTVYAHPAVQQEMAKWNAVLLMPTPLPQYNLVGRGAPPQDASWFRGKKIRATGGIGRILARFGAEPVSLTAVETRAAFASGEIDAVAFAPHAHFSFDTISLAEWWTANLNPGTVNCPVVVNADALAALPPEHREALLAAVDPSLEAYIQNYADIQGKWNVVLEVFEKAVVELPTTVVDTLRRDAPVIVRNDWIAQAREAGLPALALVNLVRTQGAAQ